MQIPATDDRLIHEIYESATQEAPWHACLTALVRSFQGCAGQIFTPFAIDPAQGGIDQHVGFPSDARQKYAQEVADVDVWYSELMRRHGVGGVLPTGLVYSTDDLVPRSMLRKSRFFVDYLRSSDVEQAIGTMIGDGTTGLVPAAVVGIFRHAHAKAFDQADMVRLSRFQGHFTIALGVRMQLHQAVQSAVESAYDAIPTPILILGLKGEVLLSNTVADSLLTRRSHPKVLFGRLKPETGNGVSQLDAALQACARCAFGAPPTTAVRLAGEIGSGVVARIVPPPAGLVLDRRAVALALLAEENKQMPSMAELLYTLYGLSPSEVALTTALCNGLSIEDYCETRQVTMNTARTQMKSVFRKTQVRRQADLMRLIVTIAS